MLSEAKRMIIIVNFVEISDNPSNLSQTDGPFTVLITTRSRNADIIHNTYITATC